jgi:hypothetical protein
MMGRHYHHDGHVIGVVKGKRGAGAGQWIVAWEDGQSQHRVLSSRLPNCATAAICQRNLDAWARWKGLDEAWDGKLPEKTTQARPGPEVPPGGLECGRQYFLKRRDKPETPPRFVEYRGMEDGFHRFSAADTNYVRPVHPLSPMALCHYEIRAYAS